MADRAIYQLCLTNYQLEMLNTFVHKGATAYMQKYRPNEMLASCDPKKWVRRAAEIKELSDQIDECFEHSSPWMNLEWMPPDGAA